MIDAPLTTEIRIAASEQLGQVLVILGTLSRAVTPTHPELAGEIAAVAAMAEKLRRLVAAGVVG